MSERWPALLTAEDAAEYLGISVTSLKRLKAAERIRSVTIRDGSMLRYRRTDLDAFIDDLPVGNGVCAANERRVAVVMLSKQQKQARPTRSPQTTPISPKKSRRSKSA